MMLQRQRQRKGAILLESAVAYPVLLVLIIAIIVLGLAVFRYQQVAHMAREGTRFVAVRGALYSKETGLPAATQADVFNAILPHGAGMDPSGITCTVTWQTSNAQTTSQVVGSSIVTTANTVTVTVTYTWNAPLFGPIPVSSTSVMPISY
jgi:Flp pilus assembly protein TadG